MSNRFDYVKYDAEAQAKQQHFKILCQGLETLIDSDLQNGRNKSLALTKLEEVYMWIGKGIRDDQIARNGSTELEEGIGNE